MKKRLANLLVALVTMVTGMFVPATAFADPDQTPGANAEEWTEVSTWADLAAALRAGGTPMRTIVNRPSRSDSADLGSK